MNRHILGLTIFLIIVKSSFFVYWGFFAPKPFITFTESEVQTLTAPTQYAPPSKRTSCFPTRNTTNRDAYAEFDVKTKILQMNFRVNDESELKTAGDRIYLHLSSGKHSRTEETNYKTSFWAKPFYQNGRIELKIKDQSDWIDESQLNGENLYVAAETMDGNFLTEPTPVLFVH